MSDRQAGGVERPTWVCLDLFAGLGGATQAFEESGRWELVTVDLEGRFDPDLQADVLDLDPADLLAAIGRDREAIDVLVIFAGHPCTVFSKVAAWQDHWDEDGNPQTEKARRHVAMLFHTVGLIRALAPRYWFLENPEGHMRRFLGEPVGSVTYCQYGADYRKPTDLWGEHPPMTYRRCSNGDACHQNTTHREKAGDQHVADALPNDPAERAKVPHELSVAIRDAVEDAIATPPPEQQTLLAATDGGEPSGKQSTGTERFDDGGSA